MATYHPIKNSRRFIEKELEVIGAANSFEIKVRRSFRGHTFALVYKTFRGGEIPLVIDGPMSLVREALRKFREANTLLIFPLVREVQMELGVPVRFAPWVFPQAEISKVFCAACGKVLPQATFGSADFPEVCRCGRSVEPAETSALSAEASAKFNWAPEGELPSGTHG